MIELIASEKTKEKLNVFNPLLGVMGVLFILFAYGIVYLDGIRYTRIPEKSSYFTLFCFTGLYLVISQFGSFYLVLCRGMKKYYFRNMLSITEMNFKLSRNKDMMYILTLLVSITLFFLGFAYSKYVILEVGDGDFLVFISSFMAVLFFTASVSVIYFKLFSEIDEERIRYHKLNCIGITKKEVKRYISFELTVLLFMPIIIGIILVFPYMSIEYVNSEYRNKILLSLVLIFLIYSIFYFIFYVIIKRKYIEAIVK
jgi:putative ABC transport system permease protein